jgi:hypothetical protein
LLCADTAELLTLSLDAAHAARGSEGIPPHVLTQLKAYLNTHPSVKYVWWPQVPPTPAGAAAQTAQTTDRTACDNDQDTARDDDDDAPCDTNDETACEWYDDAAHGGVYARLLLLLSGTVLLLGEDMYRRSFWGQLDTWLASQKTAAGGARGLYAAGAAERRCVPADDASLDELSSWSSDDAHAQLRIMCASAAADTTIARHGPLALAWIGQLDALVRSALEGLRAHSVVWMSCELRGGTPVLCDHTDTVTESDGGSVRIQGSAMHVSTASHPLLTAQCTPLLTARCIPCSRAR